jgi:hypothetical protein
VKKTNPNQIISKLRAIFVFLQKPGLTVIKSKNNKICAVSATSTKRPQEDDNGTAVDISSVLLTPIRQQQ